MILPIIVGLHLLRPNIAPAARSYVLAQASLQDSGLDLEVLGEPDVRSDPLTYGKLRICVLNDNNVIGTIAMPLDAPYLSEQAQSASLYVQPIGKDYEVSLVLSEQSTYDSHSPPAEVDFLKVYLTGQSVQITPVGMTPTSSVPQVMNSKQGQLFIVSNPIGFLNHDLQPQWPECFQWVNGEVKNVSLQHPELYKAMLDPIKTALELVPLDSTLWDCYSFAAKLNKIKIDPVSLYRDIATNVDHESGNDSIFHDAVTATKGITTLRKWIKDKKPIGDGRGGEGLDGDDLVNKSWYLSSMYNNFDNGEGLFIKREPETWEFSLTDPPVLINSEPIISHKNPVSVAICHFPSSDITVRLIVNFVPEGAPALSPYASPRLVFYKGDKKIGFFWVPLDRPADPDGLSSFTLTHQAFGADQLLTLIIRSHEMSGGDFPTDLLFFRIKPGSNSVQVNFQGQVAASMDPGIRGRPGHPFFITRNEITGLYHAAQPRWPECYGFVNGQVKNIDWNHPEIYANQLDDMSETVKTDPVDPDLWAAIVFCYQVNGVPIDPTQVYRMIYSNVKGISADQFDHDHGDDPLAILRTWIATRKPLPIPKFYQSKWPMIWAKGSYPKNWTGTRGIYAPQNPPKSWTFLYPKVES